MTTKETTYRFLKSAKNAKCKSLGAISSMNKQQMLTLAYKLGFSPTENRIVYDKKYDRLTNTSSSTTTTTRRSTRRQPQQEEKKQDKETWQEMKKRGQKIVAEARKKMAEVQKKQESTNRDLTNSKEYKKATEMLMKGSKIKTEAKNLKKQQEK